MSKTEWDYSALAETYDLRPGYDKGLVSETLHLIGMKRDQLAVDVGAGTGKLTGLLLDQGLNVVAVEPNAAMRHIGSNNPGMKSALWMGATGEALALQQQCADLVAYGSSFNVLAAGAALDECARVLRVGGIWLALWNHRDLLDPLQRAVELLIQRHVPNYDYGRRRQSPEADVSLHGAFGKVAANQRRFVAEVRAQDWVEAWRSHATLQRQAGSRHALVLREISALVAGQHTLRVPYQTKLWWAKRLAQ